MLVLVFVLVQCQVIDFVHLVHGILQNGTDHPKERETLTKEAIHVGQASFRAWPSLSTYFDLSSRQASANLRKFTSDASLRECTSRTSTGAASADASASARADASSSPGASANAGASASANATDLTTKNISSF